MTKQNHSLQADFGPPLLNRIHKLLLCSLSVCGELWPAALAKAQQIQGVNGMMLGESLKIVGPKSYTPTKPVEQDHRGFVFSTAVREGQRPQAVAMRYGDVLSGKVGLNTCSERRRENMSNTGQILVQIKFIEFKFMVLILPTV